MPFEKGQSGNPGGRPPGATSKVMASQTFKDKLMKECVETIKVIKEIRDDKKSSATDRLKASKMLFDAMMTFVTDDLKVKETPKTSDKPKAEKGKEVPKKNPLFSVTPIEGKK